MDSEAAADQGPVFSVLRRRILEVRKPVKRHGDRTPVGQFDMKHVVAEHNIDGKWLYIDCRNCHGLKIVIRITKTAGARKLNFRAQDLSYCSSLR